MGQYQKDQAYMQQALQEANKALSINEVPVGAIIVVDDQIVGRGHNKVITGNDPSAHAEVVAIRNAAANTQNYRLGGATLYVTLEPCIMCAGALLHARIDRLVYGARDHRFGAAGTQLNLVESEFLNHKAEVVAGVEHEACQKLLQSFFAAKR